jgi:DNA-nicking Smr family endonuclease
MRRIPPSDPGEQMWRRVKATVKPLKRKTAAAAKAAHSPPDKALVPPSQVIDAGKTAPRRLPTLAPPARPTAPPALDTGWERRLRGGRLEPDFTIDLHGHHVAAAHTVLLRLLDRAVAQNARVILVVAGKLRGPDEAPRGAIRRELATWLAHGPHARDILAVRNAHPRHGGAGALYIILRRARG